jgi:hypothetical protein
MMTSSVVWAHFVCDVAQSWPGVSLLVGVGAVCDRGGRRRWRWQWVVCDRGGRRCDGWRWRWWWMVGGGWLVVIEFGSGTTSTNIQQGHVFGRKYNQMARAWPQGIKTLAKPLSTFKDSLILVLLYCILIYVYILVQDQS